MAKLEDFAVVNTGHWWGVSTCEWPAVRCSNADSQNVEAAAFINARPTIANMNNIPSHPYVSACDGLRMILDL
jgi:hypothetical protein